MHDTEHPPGQWRPPKYLRDVIRAAQERSSEDLSSDGCCHKTVLERCPECPHKEFSEQPIHGPLTSAEKRLARLERALAAWKRNELNRNKGQKTWVSQEIDGILRENS